MKKGLWLGLVVSFWIFPLLGMSSPLEDKVNALKSALKADASTGTAQTAAPGVPGKAATMSAAAEDEVLNQITSGQTSQFPGNYAAMNLSQILANHPSPAVQKAGHELLEEIEAERTAKADAYRAQVTELLKRVGDTIAKATKPSDLDGILVELQKYQNQGYATENEGPQLSQQTNMAYQFATGWQDYLSHVANGNVEQACNDLRNLAQNGYGITIVPRSRILELMNTTAKVPANPSANSQVAPGSSAPSLDGILDQVKTLDQMEGALKQIDALNLPPGSDQTQTIRTLQNYVQCYHDIQAGLPANLELGNGIPALPGHEDITRKIWLLALQTLFPTFKEAPLPDEKPLDFVNRVIAYFAGREDWDLLKKALETKDSITKSTQFGLYAPDPASGLNSLISALNQEAAGQYSLAVVSYETALKSPSLDIPAKMIGEKLAAIKKDHPDDFKTGYQETVLPTMTAPYPYSNMPFRPGMPGYSYPYPGRNPSTTFSLPGRPNPAAAGAGANSDHVSSPSPTTTNSTWPIPPSGK